MATPVWLVIGVAKKKGDHGVVTRGNESFGKVDSHFGPTQYGKGTTLPR